MAPSWEIIPSPVHIKHPPETDHGQKMSKIRDLIFWIRSVGFRSVGYFFPRFPFSLLFTFVNGKLVCLITLNKVDRITLPECFLIQKNLEKHRQIQECCQTLNLTMVKMHRNTKPKSRLNACIQREFVRQFTIQ